MNKYQNLSKVIKLSDESWAVASENGLVDLSVKHLDVPFMQTDNKKFINMCSCSYLGWDRHPAILKGAIEGIERAGTLHLTTARCRLFLDLLSEFEEKLSEHFNANAIAYNSCSAASSAALPLLASGAFTKDVKPVIVFDKFAHFSLAHMKALCGDETAIFTIKNNDMDELENICKKYPKVAYVSDATYSIRGFADFDKLKLLQKQYRLFIYLDDSHGLSIIGQNGEGIAVEKLRPINEETIIVASLAKAYGSTGGVLLTGNKLFKKLLIRYGNAWSQYLNSASIGGGLASLELHKSKELKVAQDAWKNNLVIFDSYFNSINANTISPIRILELNSPSSAVDIANNLMRAGYYTSVVFFPVVPKDSAGIRIMPRSDIPQEMMHDFCINVKDICQDNLI